MDEYPLIPLLEHLSHSSPDGARSIMSRGEEGGEEAGILKPEATGGGESTPDPSEALSDDDADKKKNIIVVQGGEPGSGVDRGLGFKDEQERFQSVLEFLDKDFHKAQWSPGSPSTLYVSSADEDKYVRTRITRDEKDKEWRCPCCGCLHQNPKKRKRDDGADEEDKHDTHS